MYRSVGCLGYDALKPIIAAAFTHSSAAPPARTLATAPFFRWNSALTLHLAHLRTKIILQCVLLNVTQYSVLDIFRRFGHTEHLHSEISITLRI